MPIQIHTFMIFVAFYAFALSLTATGSQIVSTNVYPPYKFRFSIEDEGLHKREEESLEEGHVSGQYSYVDPNGYLRTIKYNSTPEAGFQAFGDIGVFRTIKDFIKPVNSQTSLKLLQEKPQNMHIVKINPAFIENNKIFKENYNRMTKHSKVFNKDILPLFETSNASYDIQLPDHHQYKIISSESTNLNSLKESVDNKTSIETFGTNSKTPNNPPYSAKVVSSLSSLNELLEDDYNGSYNNETFIQNSKLENSLQSFGQKNPKQHQRASSVPFIFPYFIYPLPHFVPLHADYRLIL